MCNLRTCHASVCRIWWRQCIHHCRGLLGSARFLSPPSAQRHSQRSVAVFLPCHQTRLPQALHCCSYVRGMLACCMSVPSSKQTSTWSNSHSNIFHTKNLPDKWLFQGPRPLLYKLIFAPPLEGANCRKAHKTNSKLECKVGPQTNKWSYSPYKLPYKWVTGVVALFNGVISPFVTGRGSNFFVWIGPMWSYDTNPNVPPYDSRELLQNCRANICCLFDPRESGQFSDPCLLVTFCFPTSKRVPREAWWHRQRQRSETKIHDGPCSPHMNVL